MKTEWRPRTYKRYPGWGCRCVCSGGYYVPEGNFLLIRHPKLIRYEITYNGEYFFSVPQRKLTLPLIRKYHKEKSNA